MPPKRIAFLVFPRLTMLDFIGAYDALRRVAAMSIDPEVTHRVIGTDAEIVDESGLKLTPDSVYEDLSKFDLLYVAGGLGTVTLMDNRRAVDYLKTWGDERPLASVCSGALLLGRAGYLKDKRATTHHQAVELLRPLCREAVTNRRVAWWTRGASSRPGASRPRSTWVRWSTGATLPSRSSPQRPWNRGGRFSLNAATPSAWSAVWRTIDMWDETRSRCVRRSSRRLW